MTTGLRGANVRVEKRLDGSLTVRYDERYLPVKECAVPNQPKPAPQPKPEAKSRPASRRGSDWDKNFNLKKGPKVWQAARASGFRRHGAI